MCILYLNIIKTVRFNFYFYFLLLKPQGKKLT